MSHGEYIKMRQAEKELNLSSYFVAFLVLSLAIIIYYIIYQQIENNTLQPWIQSKSINATALMIIVSALIGGSIGGIFGAFLAIPVAGCIRIWVKFMISENRTKTQSDNSKP